MKKSHLMAAFAACVSFVAMAGSAAAQQPAQVYLVDVAWIFKNDPTLKNRLTEMDKDAETAQKTFQAEAEQIKKKAEQLQQLAPGSVDYRNLEEALVQEKSGLQGKIALKKKDFALRMARNYLDAYVAIHDETESYCRQYGIPLVLTFTRDELKDVHPENPEEIQRAITGRVLYHAPTLDLTNYVFERIKPRSASATNAVGAQQGVGFGGQPQQQPAGAGWNNQPH